MKFAKLIVTVGIIAVDVFIWIHIAHDCTQSYSSSALNLILMIDVRMYTLPVKTSSHLWEFL